MKNQQRENRLMIFIGTVMIAVGILGVIYLSKEIASEKSQPPAPTALPPDIPDGVPLGTGFIGTGQQEFLTSYGTKTLKVEFNPVGSIKRLWRGSNPKLIIIDPYSSNYPGETKTDTWSPVLLTQGYSLYTFTPWLEVTFPIEEEYYHQWITAVARMDILYPVYAPGGFTIRYTNTSDTIEHPLRFFIITPEEYQLVRDFRLGPRNPDNISPLIGSVICLILPGFIFIFQALTRKRSRL